MAQVAPYAAIDPNQPWDDPVNWSPMSTGQFLWLVSFQDPSVPKGGTPEGGILVNYAPNEWLMHRNSSVRMNQIPDQSGTLMMSDAFGDFAIFGDPINWRDPTTSFRSSSTGFGHVARPEITFVLYADGRVGAVYNKEIAPEVFRALAGPEDLCPTPAQIARRDKPYQPPTGPVWTYLLALRGDKGLMKLSLAPDKRRLIVNFGRDDSHKSDYWQDQFGSFVKGAPITHVEFKGIFDPQELRLLLTLPKLQTISLDGNAPLGKVADVLKEFPQIRVIDSEPEP